MLVALDTALTVAQGGERFQPLSREFLLALAEEISNPVAPPPSGLAARTWQESALTLKKIFILNIKKDINKILVSVGQSPMVMLVAETVDEQVHQIEALLAHPERYSFVMTQPLGAETRALLYKQLADFRGTFGCFVGISWRASKAPEIFKSCFG